MKVASNGIRINVEDQGSGAPALVFLHYWGGSARTWRHVTARLAARFRTIATDHRGWGDSDAPPSGYALADLAADALGVIDALGLERYVLVGHSMGGKVAQWIAAQRPHGLLGLVLVAPAPPTPIALPDLAREMMAGAYDSESAVAETIDRVLAGNPLDPRDRAQVIADSLRAAPQAKKAWPSATSLEDITAMVGRIDVPTLVLAGERDRIDTPAALTAELLPRIPHASFYILPDTGHLSPLEAPAVVARHITDFAAPLV
ncbi:alpha/beta fold hydrolase [Sphingomonas sp. ABOLD]|uniref:Pimeloyl-ACP methyl ester carboxylesterase n=1 Tax=Sphingomonas trueperi TaxID=53317 RepID=A0A7X6BD48_9SPHN|nr:MULTISPECIES: alpha/beta fold hydrolase [Sphingomonas]NJB98268.1 pimeloyl-ACP methyl ester carboxylesterase [Sphingomonas trueperi]RSV41321.1 alpha/beta fold hydrolase [Sphingomonas sp. ABOLD]RSV45493.1 alpha/beta fold hydrolase [Sphingomonas sp. ABOLE]